MVSIIRSGLARLFSSFRFHGEDDLATLRKCICRHDALLLSVLSEKLQDVKPEEALHHCHIAYRRRGFFAVI